MGAMWPSVYSYRRTVLYGVMLSRSVCTRYCRVHKCAIAARTRHAATRQPATRRMIVRSLVDSTACTATGSSVEASAIQFMLPSSEYAVAECVSCHL